MTSVEARIRTPTIAFGFFKLAQSVIVSYTGFGRSVLEQACSQLGMSAGTVIANTHLTNVPVARKCRRALRLPHQVIHSRYATKSKPCIGGRVTYAATIPCVETSGLHGAILLPRNLLIYQMQIRCCSTWLILGRANFLCKDRRVRC